MIIRDETGSDAEAIFDVTGAAFENHPVSNHTEQFVIDALRAAGVLAVSLVAEIDGQVAGYHALSPVTIPTATGRRALWPSTRAFP